MTPEFQQKRSHDQEQVQELNELIQTAQKQPGVREVMEVYQYYQTVEKVTRFYAQTIATKRIVYLSDGTNSAFTKE